MMTFLAKMTVKEGKEDDFVRLAKELTEKVRANEPETTAYQFFKLRDEERGYAVYEQFTSEDAEEAHQNTEYFKALAPPLIECLDGTYVRTYLDDLD
ncbi:MAG: antibiotic biosynthesis monooxygenase family protein [Pseudomonadota bacterium]